MLKLKKITLKKSMEPIYLNKEKKEWAFELQFYNKF